MADETYTKADLDKAIKEAVEKAEEGLKAKRDELMNEVKALKAEVRKAKDIDPADLSAAEERAEKAEKALAEADKTIKTLTGERDKAVKALETESGAARSYALEAEINAAIAAGNVVPALVPAFTAMVKQQAKADLVDGKYAVTIADKPAREYIDSFLNGDDGKAFKAAALNSGGGAGGGGGGSGGAKTVTRAEFDAMSHADRSKFSIEGGKVVEAAA